MQNREHEDLEERDIFLSHRQANKDLVRQLATEIESEAHHDRTLRAWVDEAEIGPGKSIVGMVNKGLEKSRFIGLVMTPEYFQSESGWTDAEWHAALFNDPDNRKAKILPLLMEDCPYLPYLLRHLRAIDLREDNWDRGVKELLSVLRDEPLPRPISHRGQLIHPGWRIDRQTLMAERAVPEGDPDVVTENLFCNLLPVKKLPQYVYVAPIAHSLRRARRDDSRAFPTKYELREIIRQHQEEEEVEHKFMPAFRVVGEEIISFHDLESLDSPLAVIVESEDATPHEISEFLADEDDRKIVTSLLNMAIARHVQRQRLVIDKTKFNRFFFPPKDGGTNEFSWRPFKKRAQRTVAKPLKPDDPQTSWIHQAAYIKSIFLASQYYVQIIPTWVLTNDGAEVRGGPTVGRVVIKWTGRERNVHVLYHIRFWSSILRRGPGPISIRVGDQNLEVSHIPAFVQQACGIQDDYRDLLSLLDEEASAIAEEEDITLEVETIDAEEDDVDSFDDDVLGSKAEDGSEDEKEE